MINEEALLQLLQNQQEQINSLQEQLTDIQTMFERSYRRNMDSNVKIGELLREADSLRSSTNTTPSTSTSIYDKVRKLEPDEKVRKTMILPKRISEQWDSFTQQFRKVEKNDILTLALMEFMERHGQR